MSFQCDECGVTTRPYQACYMFVSETRDQIYEHKINKGMGEQKETRTIQTRGKEIVKELRLCKKCYDSEMTKGNKDYLSKPLFKDCTTPTTTKSSA